MYNVIHSSSAVSNKWSVEFVLITNPPNIVKKKIIYRLKSPINKINLKNDYKLLVPVVLKDDLFVSI